MRCRINLVLLLMYVNEAPTRSQERIYVKVVVHVERAC